MLGRGLARFILNVLGAVFGVYGLGFGKPKEKLKRKGFDAQVNPPAIQVDHPRKSLKVCDFQGYPTKFSCMKALDRITSLIRSSIRYQN